MIAETAADLLPLVFARPREALERARALLATQPASHDASIAHQVIGLWERDFGDLMTGIGHLRRARRLAARSGSAEREADVLASMGGAYVHAGRSGRAVAAFDRAAALATGHTLARVLHRRAYVMWVLGRHREALEDLRVAVPLLRRAGDVLWLARAISARGTLYLALGQVERAIADLERAEALWQETSQDYDKAVAVQNRGQAAFRVGDLPAALRHFDQAERRYTELGTPAWVLPVVRCEVLLAAGLARDALREADGAVERLDRVGGPPSRRSELLLVGARAALAAGQVEQAAFRATAAARSFAGQRRQWWATHARFVLLQARFAAGDPAPEREAVSVARELAGLGSPDAARAWLLAGRTAASDPGRTAGFEPGRTPGGNGGGATRAERHLSLAARARDRGPAFARIDGWLAQALLAKAAGRPRGVLAACRRGLDLIDEHRMTLGATELRARAAGQGAELATMAQREVRGDPRRLLAWSERWRATALAVPPARPPDDPDLLRDLTAFREIAGRAQEARASGRAVPQLERERQRLEKAIRDRLLAIRAGAAGGPGPAFEVRDLLAGLGDRMLAEIVVIDGRLTVLLCRRGRVRAFEAGTLAGAAAEAEHANAGLRRLAYGAPAPGLDAGAERLQHLLLGSAVPHLTAERLVVVPPGHLHDVPWALLPALRGKVLSVAPSASAWLRAARITPPDGPVVLVRGPGLGGGGAEVPILAGRYGDATVLEGGEADAQRVLKQIDGSRLAHIAAHGSFRADSPMFSALQLADGPLIVHDVERLERAPYRIVLSSCDSGRMEPVGGDELLGLSAALMPLGTAGIVASTVPVHDEAVVPLMLALHEGVRGGMDTAQALARARAELPGDRLHQAVGWSFSAIGAA
ncbi:CHAT domain-containing protein [Nonomuraea sp. NPDC050663]|uniref:CHAT domain-containing protein n=1 Tax=Nonomuraea sp. NPDC050663 TaxID=3364370 RepID=UPI0037BB1DE9